LISFQYIEGMGAERFCYLRLLWYATLPMPNDVDFSGYRCETRPACRRRRQTPAKPGSAQAKLARRARNVRNFHFLIYHEICAKFNSETTFTRFGMQRFRCRALWIFQGTAAKRARHAAAGGITPAKPGSAQAKLARRARNVKNFHF
jgi:hypothetical protein